jgi:zinc/manganese transport system substrate-binding protein
MKNINASLQQPSLPGPQTGDPRVPNRLARCLRGNGRPGRTFLQGILATLLLATAMRPALAADLNVFACEPEWAALTRELAGTHVDITTATSARQDPHHIEARPSLIARLRGADLAVCTGAGLEIGWLPMLQRESGNTAVQNGKPGLFEAAMQVDRLEVPGSVDRAQGDIHPEGNPHVQMDPRRIATIATALTARLRQLDPAHAADYDARGADFSRRWQDAMQRWNTAAGPLHGARVVVHHKGWAYLFDWLGLEAAGELEPKPGVPPSAGHLAELKALLAAKPAKMVIYAAYQDNRAADWLSREAGIPAVELPFTVGGSAGAGDLFGLFDDTLRRMLGALHDAH